MPVYNGQNSQSYPYGDPQIPITSLTDIAQFPVNISDYILQQSIETSAFFQSGIINPNVPAEVQLR